MDKPPARNTDDSMSSLNHIAAKIAAISADYQLRVITADEARSRLRGAGCSALGAKKWISRWDNQFPRTAADTTPNGV
jgi:hypothetical protein